jgi:SAM-dependent methyltransferase
VIDIGGGDSRLVDELLDEGLECVSVLDISEASLDRARARLGPGAARVRWIRQDVTDTSEPLPPVDIWHDRAVFHFLVDRAAREAYKAQLDAAVKPGGAVVMATFSLKGPDRCSGLPVMRYSSETLSEELGPAYSIEEMATEEHRTPQGAVQEFLWVRFRKAGRP